MANIQGNLNRTTSSRVSIAKLYQGEIDHKKTTKIIKLTMFATIAIPLNSINKTERQESLKITIHWVWYMGCTRERLLGSEVEHTHGTYCHACIQENCKKYGN